MQDLLNFLEEKGFTDFEPQLDRELQRFDRAGEQTGWFWGSLGSYGFITAKVGDWKTGEKYEFTSNQTYSEEENKVIQAELKESKKLFEKQKEESQKEAAKDANKQWDTSFTDKDSPYLTKKGFNAGATQILGLRTTHSSWGSIDTLAFCRDINTTIYGFQKIQEDGFKAFQPGQRIDGLFHLIGKITAQTKKIFLAEGIATAASIHFATGAPTICGFNAGNLPKVAAELRKKYPILPIIICGDDDRFTIVNGVARNAGRIEAEKAAAICAGIAVYPKFKDLENRGTDFNDLHVSEGLDAVTSQLNMIVPPNPSEAIATQSTGFHNVKIGANGKFVHIPNYVDLMRYFEKLTPYKIMGGSGICYAWIGTHFSEYEKAYLNGFAQTHFNPPADNKKCLEFRGLIERTNFASNDWFEETTIKKTNFLNGILDNETLKLSPHTPNIGFRHVLKFNYTPTALCPHFDKFMHDITIGDESLQKLLLEFVGYALSNDSYWIHQALVLEGQGSNGKSTFMGVIRELAGHANCTAFTLTDLKEEGHRQCLDGKLLNMAEETPSRSLQDSSGFKSLVGGAVISARQLYKKPYSFKNRAKLIFACNDMPETGDTSHGYVRRFLIAPFRARFSDELGNKDPLIEEKLSSELPGIFNKVIHAYREVLKRRKFSDSEASRKALHDYRREIDPALGWLEKTLVFHPLGNGMDIKFAPISKIYDEYRRDIENEGHRPINNVHFGKKLSRFVKDYDKRHAIKKIDKKTHRVLIATTRESGEIF